MATHEGHRERLPASFRRSPFRTGLVRGMIELRSPYEVLVWVFSSTTIEHSYEILRSVAGYFRGGRTELQRKELPDLRLAMHLGDFWVHGAVELPAKSVAASLNLIRKLISENNDAAWTALERLCIFQWSDDSNRKLNESFKFLCIALEKRATGVLWRPVVGLVNRIAETAGTERYLAWLLNIMGGEKGDSQAPYRKVRAVRKSAIAKIARLVKDDVSLAGFARWFARVDTSLRPRRDEPIQAPKLRIDLGRIVKLVAENKGDIRAGAITIAANSAGLSYEISRQLLRYASDEYDNNDCWAELIEGTTKSGSESEGIDFLEDILSAASEYSKAVKYAAHNKYEQIARSSTIDILQQEAQLGLPLQDVLKLTRNGKDMSEPNTS